MNPLTKKCNTCGTTKELSEFYKSKDTKLGVTNKCKACCKIYASEYSKKQTAYIKSIRAEEVSKKDELLPSPYKHGYIYVFHAPEVAKVKIGFSTDVEMRLYSMRTDCPCDLILLYSFKGTRKEEHILHKAFSEYRIRNEWFSDEVIPLILDLALLIDTESAFTIDSMLRPSEGASVNDHAV